MDRGTRLRPIAEQLNFIADHGQFACKITSLCDTM
jgi:hypothetical protein